MKTKTLTFNQAVKALLKGKLVHKLDWMDKECFALLIQGTLHIRLADGTIHKWILRDVDLEGKDYIVLNRSLELDSLPTILYDGDEPDPTKRLQYQL